MVVKLSLVGEVIVETTPRLSGFLEIPRAF